MFYILLFISVLIFGIIWTIITNKYLKRNARYKNTDRTGYDERQRTMFLEIFSKNFCRFSLYLFHRYDFKIFALYQGHHTVYPFNQFPELAYILIVALLLVMNYFIVKRNTRHRTD